MARPRIGITMDYADTDVMHYSLTSAYATSIERAGGLPLLLPFRSDMELIGEFADAVEGMLFTGGNDLDPSLFGQTRHSKAVAIEPARQRFELALLAEIEQRRMPTLGVCLGCQLMNIHRGGSLHQFLPDLHRADSIEHRRMSDSSRRHEVRIEPGTILDQAVGRPVIAVNTRHKQSIDQLGRGLRLNAVAPDGVIEGIEDASLPLFLAVQWHPENLSDQPEHLAPFKLLVAAAGQTLDRRRLHRHV